MSVASYLNRRGALPAAAALAIVVPILTALRHAHEKGVLHRDISPRNIFLVMEPVTIHPVFGLFFAVCFGGWFACNLITGFLRGTGALSGNTTALTYLLLILFPGGTGKGVAP